MKKNAIIVLLSLCIGVSNAQVKRSDYSLKKWPKTYSPEEIGFVIADKYLQAGYTMFGRYQMNRPVTHVTYPDVCLWLGGLWFSEVTNNKDLFNRFESRFMSLLDTASHLLPKPNHVDNNVFGAIPSELYLQTENKDYLAIGLHYADSQWLIPEDASPEQSDWSEKGYSWQTRLWIDDMFMITAVQAQAYRATNDPEYIDRTAYEMVLYLDELQLKNGLFYHSPEAHFCWGRGNGWMAVGMAETLRILPTDHKHRARIMAGYHNMMNSLLSHQTKEGMWRQIIDDPESWEETSSTAMFLYAIVTGVKNGWLDKKIYGAAARKGWMALIGYLNENNDLTEVCAGTNIQNSRDHYMNRPRIIGDLHGHAPLLWCATALLR